MQQFEHGGLPRPLVFESWDLLCLKFLRPLGLMKSRFIYWKLAVLFFLLVALPGKQWESLALTQCFTVHTAQITGDTTGWSVCVSVNNNKTDLCDLLSQQWLPTLSHSDNPHLTRPQRRKWKRTFQHDVTLKPTDKTFSAGEVNKSRS